MAEANHNPPDLLDITDRLNELRAFLRAAYMAVETADLDKEEEDAIETVLSHVDEGLKKLVEEVHPSDKKAKGNANG